MSEDNRRRYPPNLLGLLNFCTEYTQEEDAPSASTLSAMSDERRQWLSEAINSMQGSDPIKLMLQDIQVILNATGGDADIDKQELALEDLQLHTEDVDLANDFHKIGGFHMLPLLLASHYEGLRWRTADLIATLTQNNPYCQKQAVSLLPLLMKLLDDASEAELTYCRQRCNVYNPHERRGCIVFLMTTARSVENPLMQEMLRCLTRDSAEAQLEFVKHDGFSVLLRAMQSSIEKLQTKSAFLMSVLCQQKPHFTNVLCDMGAVEQLVGLLSMEHRNFHEQLIIALYYLIVDNPRAQTECRQHQLGLKALLSQRQSYLAGKDEYQEELDYVVRVHQLCFSELDSDSADR